MGAPTAKVETIVLVSPIKINALVCALVSCILILISLFTDQWLNNAESKRGLWEECTLSKSIPNLAYSITAASSKDNFYVCIPLQKAFWVHISAALLVVSLGCALIGFVLLILGLKHKKGPERKKKYYRAVIFVLIFGFVSVLLGLLLYPAMMIQELNKSNKDWYLGWSYGLGWAAALFLAGANILILCDRNREEILYTERLVISDENDNFEENQEAKIKTAR